MNPEPLSPILVADDNATDVFFLQRRLRLAGVSHPLEHVEDGMAAVRWIERHLMTDAQTVLRPWLVFVDLKMPRMDGFEVLSWLKSRGLMQQLTVVVVSTSDEPIDVERALTLGAYRYLTKYPSAEDLAEIVARAQRHANTRPTSFPEQRTIGLSVPKHA